MSTQLSQFCDHFVATVRPLLAPLDRAIAALDATPPATSQDASDTPAPTLRNGLADRRQEFQHLCEKVAGQRAFVLIFGPLKSGKSTLMNAIAASYVSEVRAR